MDSDGGGQGRSATILERGIWTISGVMRGLDPRIHLTSKMDGLPGQARQ
jgi:hypothetical protein